MDTRPALVEDVDILYELICDLAFRIPGAAKGTTTAALLASAAAALALILGFFPPSEGSVHLKLAYPFLLAVGIALSLYVPFLLLKAAKKAA